MTKIALKRVYDNADPHDGYRVLVDRLWPRGVKKEALQYDLWDKDITPSSELRQWFHADPQNRWDAFSKKYQEELNHSQAVKDFITLLHDYPVVTLLYASKDTVHTHAKVLKAYLEKHLPLK